MVELPGERRRGGDEICETVGIVAQLPLERPSVGDVIELDDQPQLFAVAVWQRFDMKAVGAPAEPGFDVGHLADQAGGGRLPKHPLGRLRAAEHVTQTDRLLMAPKLPRRGVAEHDPAVALENGDRRRERFEGRLLDRALQLLCPVESLRRDDQKSGSAVGEVMSVTKAR